MPHKLDLLDINQLHCDSVAVTYPTNTQEVYTFLNGGVSGNTVLVITINYTDSTKANILNVSRTPKGT